MHRRLCASTIGPARLEIRKPCEEEAIVISGAFLPPPVGGREGGQVTGGVRWMLWKPVPRKDVASHETRRGAARRL
jgi:hypothetical protein